MALPLSQQPLWPLLGKLVDPAAEPGDLDSPGFLSRNSLRLVFAQRSHIHRLMPLELALVREFNDAGAPRLLASPAAARRGRRRIRRRRCCHRTAHRPLRHPAYLLQTAAPACCAAASCALCRGACTGWTWWWGARRGGPGRAPTARRQQQQQRQRGRPSCCSSCRALSAGCPRRASAMLTSWVMPGSGTRTGGRRRRPCCAACTARGCPRAARCALPAVLPVAPHAHRLQPAWALTPPPYAAADRRHVLPPEHGVAVGGAARGVPGGP